MKRMRRPRESTVHSVLECYLAEINATPLLTAAEERELAWLVEQGDMEARDRMVRANLRLVVNVARHYVGRGLSLEDLIEEGNLGLLRAVEGFDPAMQTRFSTYATFWIRQSIRRALVNTAPLVRLPAYVVELLNTFRKEAVQLRESLGRQPTTEEVTRRLRLPRRKLHILLQALQMQNPTMPLDRPEAGRPIADMLLDRRIAPPGSHLEEVDNQRTFRQLLATLEPREAALLRMRFGLDEQPPMTLQEVGDSLGLTRERVRQIEKKVLQELGQLLTCESTAAAKPGERL